MGFTRGSEVDVLSLEPLNGERWQTGRAEQSPNHFFLQKEEKEQTIMLIWVLNGCWLQIISHSLIFFFFLIFNTINTSVVWYKGAFCQKQGKYTKASPCCTCLASDKMPLYIRLKIFSRYHKNLSVKSDTIVHMPCIWKKPPSHQAENIVVKISQGLLALHLKNIDKILIKILKKSDNFIENIYDFVNKIQWNI